jgi:protein-S-isoprenylcysteine O-methyltransferase Ste14
LSIVVLPLVILSAGSGNLSVALSRPPWLTSLVAELAAIPAAMGLAAVIEFARRGRGTPFPYDPPEELVTTGPYAYVRNPMQLSMTLLMFLTGVLLGSPLVMAAALVAAIFSAGFAAWQEGGDLELRYGERWLDYRRRVRSWIPRWKPRFDAEDPSMVLYYATTCVACNEVGGWISRRSPSSVELRAAENAPVELRRLTADFGVGRPRDQGVVAFADAIERVNLGWALMAWVIRVPVVAQVVQLAADALGAGPRTIARAGPTTPDSLQ